jgi:hypothetical protein
MALFRRADLCKKGNRKCKKGANSRILTQSALYVFFQCWLAHCGHDEGRDEQTVVLAFKRRPFPYIYIGSN